MKMGTPKSDRIYEEITDRNKLNHILSEVKYSYPVAACLPSLFLVLG